MNRFNQHFSTHFSSCLTLVEGHDPHRDRRVVVKAIPGEFEVVGITDGVDAWVAPITVAPSALFDKVRVAMDALRKGKPMPEPTVRRRPLHATTEQPTIIRRR